MKKNKKISRREKGSLTIELVLIFPVLMLLFFLFFQVSVMLLTYHSLQTTVSHAALAATTASSMDEITAVVNAGTANWYYKTNELSPITTAEEWDDQDDLKFRILEQDGTGWKYAVTMPQPGTNVMVEIKLGGMKTKYPHLWLMPQFKGVDEDSDSFVVSAMGRRM
ncbi:MAG: pilus assembly protein [Thermoguttaceae bacterium]|nr:pilus assembly protein [Thermoguttaceae bacterium]MBQ9455440.1 pilus assembly protein [Thermoguttaceae bacterium]